ncbi:non-canonical purine NTP pyrophosphatase [Patescibacteria group bacterium]|nr:non-canonical purine NTP pyrophosphatase [Patescibacteria group bacterium]
MKLLIATHNQGKIKEFSELLKPYNTECVNLSDLNIHENVEETGNTFAQNALIKAKTYCNLANMPTLADDGGIMIDALNGEPGVKSRRWKGYEMSDEEMVDYTLERLNGIPTEKRTAHLVVNLALIFPDGREYSSEAAIDGVIADKQLIPIIKGYPFRSIFIVSGINKVYGELTEEEHRQYAQRVKALKNLLTHLQ